MATFYHEDLAYIHHAGHGDFSRQASPGLLQILERHRITRGTLLDLGCGSGIWAREAQRSGFEVVGVDQSAAMIRIARRLSPASRFHAASLHRFAFPLCSVVTAIGEAFNYMSGAKVMDLESLFRRLERSLLTGGLLMFDLLVAEGPPLNPRPWRAGADWAVMVDVREDRAKRILTRTITLFRRKGRSYRRSEETHHLKVFKTSEVVDALRRAGFSVRLRRAWGDVPLAPRRQGFLARKLGRFRFS